MTGPLGSFLLPRRLQRLPLLEGGIRVINTSGRAVEREKVLALLNPHWEEAGIRFDVVDTLYEEPLRNILRLRGRVVGAGTLTLTMNGRRFPLKLRPGESAEQVAARLARAIRARGGNARVARYEGSWLVVLPHEDLAVEDDRPGLEAAVGELAYGRNLTELELHALGLNFGHPDPTVIDLHLVGANHVVSVDGQAGHDGRGLEGMKNAIFLPVRFVTSPSVPHLLAHEMGHVLLDGGSCVHSEDEKNLMHPSGNGCGLDPHQVLRARQRSGPGSSGPLLLQPVPGKYVRPALRLSRPKAGRPAIRREDRRPPAGLAAALAAGGPSAYEAARALLSADTGARSMILERLLVESEAVQRLALLALAGRPDDWVHRLFEDVRRKGSLGPGVAAALDVQERLGLLRTSFDAADLAGRLALVQDELHGMSLPRHENDRTTAPEGFGHPATQWALERFRELRAQEPEEVEDFIRLQEAYAATLRQTADMAADEGWAGVAPAPAAAHDHRTAA